MTLVEIVVAVCLCSILGGILLANLPRRRCGERAVRSACLSNVRQIGLAFKQYAVDNNDCFPGIGNATNRLASSSVFLELTKGNYLQVGKIYICPSDETRRVSRRGDFGPANNSYACVVADATGLVGLSETNSTDNPLVLDLGLGGAPDFVANLTTNRWIASPHARTDGGNVLYAGGQASFQKFLDCGADGTNGYVLEP